MNWPEVVIKALPWLGVALLLGLGGYFVLPRLSNLGKVLTTVFAAAIGIFIAVAFLLKPNAPGAIVRGVAEGVDPYRNQVGAVDATMRARLLDVVTDDIYDCKLVADVLGETPNPVWCARLDLEVAKLVKATAGIRADTSAEELRQAIVDAIIKVGVPEAEAKRKLAEVRSERPRGLLELLAAPLSVLAKPPDPLPTGTIGSADMGLLVEGVYALPVGLYLVPLISIVFIAILRFAAHVWKWR